MSKIQIHATPRFTFPFIALFIALLMILPCQARQLIHQPENERTVSTITDEDFQLLVQEREKGLAGFHKNVDPNPLVPACDDAVCNWCTFPEEQRERLIKKQEEMFRQGKITMIVMAGGEATRFGGPKTFVTVSNDLGEFLEIKAANLNWMRKTYQTHVPLYVLSSEKRLQAFKDALAERRYYGLNPEDFRWYVQGTVDTFIPTDQELRANFQGEELNRHLRYAEVLRRANPDGIYRFKGERRRVPPGHFDAITAFIISGLLSEALASGIEFAPLVNIDNLEAILKNDGMIAYFAEKGDDFGFLLAEKNLAFTIKNKLTGKMIHPKLIVRFREQVLSFDGVNEFIGQAENAGILYRLNQTKKSVDVYDALSGQQIEIEMNVKPETGGTLVQPLNASGEPCGNPILREGFELPPTFDHANAAFFNTNTIILNLKGLLRFLEVPEEQLSTMSFEERSHLVREKLIKQLKTHFEFKNHEVEGEYPEYGSVKDGRTKIAVSQATRILLQAAQLKGARAGYLFAPRNTVFAPVKEPEDKKTASEKHAESLKGYLLSDDAYGRKFKHDFLPRLPRCFQMAGI